jgi:hypothetical protein
VPDGRDAVSLDRTVQESRRIGRFKRPDAEVEV